MASTGPVTAASQRNPKKAGFASATVLGDATQLGVLFWHGQDGVAGVLEPPADLSEGEALLDSASHWQHFLRVCTGAEAGACSATLGTDGESISVQQHRPGPRRAVNANQTVKRSCAILTLYIRHSGTDTSTFTPDLLFDSSSSEIPTAEMCWRPIGLESHRDLLGVIAVVSFRKSAQCLPHAFPASRHNSRKIRIRVEASRCRSQRREPRFPSPRAGDALWF